MELTYTTTDNGYTILKDGVAWITQTDYYPYQGETIEESAQKHIENILADVGKEENQTSELEALKAQVAIQEQAITELSMFVATLGV